MAGKLGSLTGDLADLQAKSGWGHPLPEHYEAEHVEEIIRDSTQIDAAAWEALVEHHLGGALLDLDDRAKQFIAEKLGITADYQPEGGMTRASAAREAERVRKAVERWAGEAPDEFGERLGSFTSDNEEREAAERRARHRALFGERDDEQPGSLVSDLTSMQQAEDRHWRAGSQARSQAFVNHIKQRGGWR